MRSGSMHTNRSHPLVTSLLGLALLASCVTEQPEDASELVAESGASYSNDVILDWNEIAYNAAVAATYFGPLLFSHDRGFTMMHIAQHDALNAIQSRYQRYVYTASDSKAHPIAATAQAARDVMVHVYPDQAATFDAALASWLATVPNGNAKTRGIALGKATANAIITLRANDGIAEWGEYTPGTGPGRYQFVPPFDFVLQPALATFPPFGVESPDQFRVGPPPSLTSSKYTAAFNEVKSVGSLNSTTRTQDQTEYAAFWWELSDAGWNRIARITAEQEGLGLWRTARLFALNNMALLDGYITGWDSKFHYDFWRPYTAIRAAATDGNSQTTADPAWESYQLNPPVQDYPSTHSVLGKASATVLAESFRTDRITFDFNSPTALPGKEVRRYHSFAFAATENALSRLYAGIHFRFSTDVGVALGSKVGKEVVENNLRPIGFQSIYH
jgi:membrane-associated phospholipid phosphatase